MSVTGRYEFNIPDYVKIVMERLFSAGESVYIVGGSVRDALLNKDAHDFDLTSSALPERVIELFSDMRVIPTGLSHGTVTVVSDGHPLEITTFRVDGEYRDMRHPEEVIYTKRIEEDLSRRDFTVNAMAYNQREGLVDVFFGISDLNNKIIRTVRDPYERFNEDALRIMRAFRFSAQLGFEIDIETLKAAERMRFGLERIARERIFSELIKLITSEEPKAALMLMQKADVLKTILPQYTVSERAISLLSRVPNNDIARLSALFCDSEPSKIREMLSSLKASNRQKRVALIVEESRKAYSSRYDVAKLKARLSDDVEIALLLSVLLGFSDDGALSYLEDKTPYSISQLAIDGAELGALGLCGREIGEMLSYLLEKVMEEPSFNEKNILLNLAKNKLTKTKNDREE